MFPVGPAWGEALLVELRGTIDRFQAVYIQRAVERAQREEAEYLIVEIDTFGGLVDSALRIASALGSSSVPTVAWVASQPDGTSVSWSAGALIALATNRIYMSPGTSIGAAAPVVQAPGAESSAADEKTVSAIRGQIAALAEKNGHSTVIARAMVDPALEAYLVEVDGEERIVDRDGLDSLRRGEESGTLQLSLLRTIVEAGSLLTLTAGEMLSLGVSAGSPATLDELAGMLDLDRGAITRITPAPADRVVAVLTSTGFTSLLILIGIVAVFLEVSNPGFGLPGTVAVAAFATLFAGNMLLGRVGSLEIILFMVGLVLLVFEILIIPGFGVAGITGLAAIATSLILSLQEFVVPEQAWQWELVGRNALVVLGSMALALFALLIMAMIIPRRPFFSRLALVTTQDAAMGYSAQPESVAAELLGKSGTVRGDLRPAGSVILENGEVITVESEGEYVERGARVTVSRVDGNRVVVRRSS
ncbi:MAG: nodulation protein NfeD [Spirochaetaceae bacterium]|nr:MAG: nodulation protein NfeD [Spirochaetaceae bacterium]